MKFKVSAILPMPAETYFVERDSSAFRSLVCEMCKLESLEMGNSWLEGDAEVYEFVTKPDIHRYVPHQFKHFIPGGDLHYTDVIEYNPKCIERSPYCMRVHSIPPIFSSKAKIESNMIIEEVTPETCRQTLEGVVDIKIIGLGHVAEKIIVENLKGVYKGVPKIVERWVKFRNEVMKQPGGKEILIQGRPKNTAVNWINDQIRALIKAEDSESEASDSHSSASPHDSYQQGQLPSVEEMMEQCSLHDESSVATDTDDDDDRAIFFDARENPTFMNLNSAVQQSLHPVSSLDRKMEKDQRHAAHLVTEYQKAGHKVRKMEVDAASPSITGQASRIESQRFGPDYNEQLHEWRQFWKEHEVPEARHVKHLDFRSRLGHVFGIGAEAGMFKRPEKEHTDNEASSKHKDGKKHRRFHLRHKHRQPVEYEDQGVPSTEKGSLGGSHQTGGASSTSSEVQSEGHRKSRSGGFVKDLFARRKSHENQQDKTHDRPHRHDHK